MSDQRTAITSTADDQQARSKWAEFSATNHAIRSGWATYHRRPILRPWWRLRCRLGHHAQPTRSRGGYGKCPRCSGALKWFVIGQHRYDGLGGLDNGSSEREGE